MPKRNWTRWWKWATIGTALVLIVAVVVGWMLFQHIPDWYRPIEIPQDAQPSVAANCVNTFDGIGGRLHSERHPFEVRFHQDRINAWLRVPAEFWPPSFRWPDSNRLKPQVLIEPDGVRLAVTWSQGRVRTVFNAKFDLRADAEGITLRLLEVAAGSLPIPRSKVQEFLPNLDRQAWPAGEPAHHQLGNRPLPSLTGLYDGIVLPNAWIWPEDQPFKITRIELRHGEAILTLDPLPFQAGGRSKPSSDDSASPIWNISPGPASPGSR